MKKPTEDSTTQSSTRRRFLGQATLGAAAATLGAATRSASAQTASAQSVPATKAPSDMAQGGKYPMVPLRKEQLRVTAVQSTIRPPTDMKNPAKEMKTNLDHMLDLVDAANGFPGKQDLVCFHEQPIMGWNEWTREETLRVSIEVPGPETETLGRKAKEHGCYISFGTYARDKDWPGHVLLNGILIAPDGRVVANHWKTNNMRGFRPGWDIATTSIYDVLDRYREMYGEDAVLPIARTDIGNISCSITPNQPDIQRALAMKGLEIRLSSSSGGYLVDEAAAVSRYNRLWSVVCNNAVTPGRVPEFGGSGDTAIFGPTGAVVARARSFNEELVTATIPMAEFRRTRAVPEVPMAMLAPVYAAYAPRYSPNLLADYQPKDAVDAARHFASKRNW